MGATASKVDGPLETLDADQVHAVVAGFPGPADANLVLAAVLEVAPDRYAIM